MEKINGLKPTLTQGSSRKGYEIFDLMCVKCGQVTSAKKDEEIKCPECKGTKFKQVGRVSADKVEQIINQKLKYRCETCGKTYDTPTLCCNGNYEIGGDKMVWAYYCSGCKRVYSQPVECCEGYDMFEGYYKPESWFKHQMAPHLSIPKYDKHIKVSNV